MECFCGIVDFSSHTTDFCAMVRMWRSLAPLCRGFSYTRGGVSLVCERGKNLSATRPSPFSRSKRENATVILSAPPTKNPLLATELITRYICGGLESLEQAEPEISFALVDEGERLLAVFTAGSPIYWAKLEEKILFSTARESIYAYFGTNTLPPSLYQTEIAPHGKALFCNLKKS